MDDIMKKFGIFEEVEKKVKEVFMKRPGLTEFEKKQYESFLESLRYTTSENIYEVAHPRELAENLLDSAIRFKEMSDGLHHETRYFITEDTEAIEFEEKVSRLLLGVSCELILKSMFLLEGYCIHRIHKTSNKKFPTKLEEIKKEDRILDRTVSFADLLEHLDCILPPGMSAEEKEAVSTYLSIAKDWRDNESHFGVRHWAVMSFRSDVNSCFEYFKLTAEALLKDYQGSL